MDERGAKTVMNEQAVNVEEAVRAHIQKTIHMSLGTSANNIPWVCEVHFAYDQQLNLYFRSKPSTRHSQEIASNPLVAGNIVKQHELSDAVVGVYFEGSAEMLQNVTEESDAYKSMSAKSIAGPDTLEEAKDSEGHQFYKITVTKWYVFGTFSTPNGEKYTLEWYK